eukprot:3542384-Pyramimonas_sp.AAC.1
MAGPFTSSPTCLLGSLHEGPNNRGEEVEEGNERIGRFSAARAQEPTAVIAASASQSCHLPVWAIS